MNNDTGRPSVEAQRAIDEARAARIALEQQAPEVHRVSRLVRAHIEANDFIDTVQRLVAQAMEPSGYPDLYK